MSAAEFVGLHLRKDAFYFRILLWGDRWKVLKETLQVHLEDDCAFAVFNCTQCS